jgi:hypothetical protein
MRNLGGLMTLTSSEISHLLGALQSMKDEGYYYGNKEQYWKRHDVIVAKLQKQLEILKNKKVAK